MAVMVRVLHVITSIDSNKGGTSHSSLCHLNNQSEKITNHLIYFEKSFVNGIDRNIIPYLSRAYLQDLFRINFYKKIRSYDIVHIHGLWQFQINMVLLLSLIFNRKIVVSVHGMLEPWSIKQKRVLKFVVLFLVQRKFLNKVNCLCATSTMELNSIRINRISNSYAVIPNSIKLEDYSVKDWSVKSKKRKIIFISRIHPKKGLEILFEALAMLDDSILGNLIVEIIGDGEVNYLNKLRLLVNKLSLQNIVEFSGSKYGNEKIESLRSADIFVLPSFSENFGNVVIESLACGIPVITTTNTPWEILTTMNCGWWIENTSETLFYTLQKALDLDLEKLAFMGQNGRSLVKLKFSESIVANSYLSLYTSIKSGNSKSDIV